MRSGGPGGSGSFGCSFSSEGVSGPFMISRGPVAHSGSETRAPSLASGGPSATKWGPADSGALANWFVPPPLENTFRRHWNKIGHAAYHSLRRGETHTIRRCPRHFKRDLLAKKLLESFRWPHMTAVRVTDQTLDTTHQLC